MQAVTVHEGGELRHETVPDPEPGPGEVLVELRAAALNRRDLLVRDGVYPYPLPLVPGSDGSCRAIRETMAMGRAVIGARRGMIPEIVDDGTTGLVIDDTPETIAGAIERLAADRARCAAMGAAGREKALRLYDVTRQAAAVKAAYEQLLG